MQRHVPTQITRRSRRSPLTPPPTPSAPTSTAKLRFQRLFKPGEAEVLRRSKGWNHSLLVSSLFCIADLQPDWISHPRAHLCANVTLTSLTQRCHSLLAGSLFPICRFYSGRSGKIWWHSCEGGFFSSFERPSVSLWWEERQQRPFPCWGDGRRSIWMQIVALRHSKQPSIIPHLSTAPGVYLLSWEPSKWSARSLPAIPCWLYLQLGAFLCVHMWEEVICPNFGI